MPQRIGPDVKRKKSLARYLGRSKKAKKISGVKWMFPKLWRPGIGVGVTQFSNLSRDMLNHELPSLSPVSKL